MTDAQLSRFGKAALKYAELGWRVFPLLPREMLPLNPCAACLERLPAKAGPEIIVCDACGEKHGAAKLGQRVATTKAHIIASWWAKYPDANVGIATGDGLVFVDVNVRDVDGLATLQRLVEQNGDLPPTPFQNTGLYGERRGRQYTFHVDFTVKNSAGEIGAPVDADGQRARDETTGRPILSGIDIRGDGGYIVAAPSVHPSGVIYEWGEGARPSLLKVAAAPDWLVVMLKPTVKAAAPAAAKDAKTTATVRQLKVVGGREAPDPGEQRAQPDIHPLPPKVKWLFNDPAEWREHVVFKDSETAVLHPKAVKNAVTMLLHRSDLAELFVLNKRTHSIIVKYQPPWTSNGTPYPRRMNDSDIVGLQCYLETFGMRLGKSSITDAIAYAAHEREEDPVLDKLNSLQWDQKPRLDHWLIDAMGASDTSFVRQVSAKWMIAAVARIIRPGSKFDHMLVLEGEQGVAKSAAFRILATSVFGDDSYTENLSSIESKDAMIELTGRIIVELAELTVLKKADYDAAKGFLSRLWDDVRLPWDKTTTRLLRSCVFGGTVNPDGMGWLKDPTGNRRYWPVTVQKLDEEKLTANAPQLWAEAKHRFQAGEKWWLEDQVVIDEAKAAVMERTEEDVWGEKIDRFIAERTSVRITDVLDSFNIEAARLTPADNKRVGSHLRKRGWSYTGKQTVREGKKGRWWIAPDGATLFDRVVDPGPEER